MTIEEVRTLDMEQCEERAKEIAAELETAEDMDALTEELNAIEERKQVIQTEAEEKRAAIEAVLDGEGEEIEQQEEKRTMNIEEIRKSQEYMDAWVEYVKSGYKNDEEVRALLTDNANSGSIAVPTYVEETIATAWEKNAVFAGIKKTFFKGNLKVGVEMSASGAVAHTEGGEAINPEELVIEYVNLIPTTIKKLVEVSDEVLDFHGQAMIDYLENEIGYQIVKLIEAGAVGAMINNGATSAMSGATLTTADIITAEGQLGGEASNLVLITTRANAAALKADALSANYGYDPFDGMPVIYVDAAAMSGAEAIVADLSGVQANFPKGYEVEYKFDDKTSMAADMVRILGRLPVAVGVVSTGKVVAITASSN